MSQRKTFIVEVALEADDSELQLPAAQELADLLTTCVTDTAPAAYRFTAIRVYDDYQHYQLGQPDGVVEPNAD